MESKESIESKEEEVETREVSEGTMEIVPDI